IIYQIEYIVLSKSLNFRKYSNNTIIEEFAVTRVCSDTKQHTAYAYLKVTPSIQETNKITFEKLPERKIYKPGGNGSNKSIFLDIRYTTIFSFIVDSKNTPVWALAAAKTFLHSSLSNARLLHALVPIFLRSFSIPSIHLNFGLPTLLLPSGFNKTYSKIIIHHEKGEIQPLELRVLI
ncbi:hypothetical protein C0J52_10134, partial [Blattella germanica]